LIEGADLTVRDRRVFLKTIEGLQPVDVILRRVDDSFCDPLELRADSALGVSGLVEATRAGTVTVANALGAGLMESPAFLAFLPGGLTRVSKSPDELLVSPQSGGGSKDTWVLAPATMSRPESGHIVSEPRLAEQVMPGVPSRAADHLFWLGRYTERLEQLLRV